MNKRKCPQCGSTDVKEFTTTDSSKSSDFFSILFDLLIGSFKGNRPEHTIYRSYLDNKSSTSYTRKYKCNRCGHVWK